jgi:hypothetical protein
MALNRRKQIVTPAETKAWEALAKAAKRLREAQRRAARRAPKKQKSAKGASHA